jgi:hypothetical protein
MGGPGRGGGPNPTQPFDAIGVLPTDFVLASSSYLNGVAGEGQRTLRQGNWKESTVGPGRHCPPRRRHACWIVVSRVKWQPVSPEARAKFCCLLLERKRLCESLGILWRGERQLPARPYSQEESLQAFKAFYPDTVRQLMEDGPDQGFPSPGEVAFDSVAVAAVGPSQALLTTTLDAVF